jgi:hypothetical protein
MPSPDLSPLATGYLAVLSSYHVATGLLSFTAPGLALRFYRGAYGCNPVELRHLRIILRPWGALAVFAGLAGFVALGCPPARAWIQAAVLILLAMRVAYRIGLRRELADISGIPPRHNAMNIGLLLIGGTLLAADLLTRAWG